MKIVSTLPLCCGSTERKSNKRRAGCTERKPLPCDACCAADEQSGSSEANGGCISLSELVSEKIKQWIRMKSPDTPVVKATGSAYEREARGLVLVYGSPMPPFLQQAQHYGRGLQQLGEDVGSQWGPAGWPNFWPEEEVLLPSTELSSSHQSF
ncbi:hypothetical protein EYF80_040507 [Liparis tanakae]|uniref:Uncharacterized protein n=1 Tax=Liparis tanakae TaxID=230148 RepID=A0A4Z2G810_9TELE|nr:hypothetical protein EYF80_040507 [Liparis tanakae]